MPQAYIVGPNPTPELLPQVFHELRTEWQPLYHSYLASHHGLNPSSRDRWASASVNIPSLLNYRIDWGNTYDAYPTDEAILMHLAREVAKPLFILEYPRGSGWVERRPHLKEALAPHIGGDFDDWFQRIGRIKGEWRHSPLAGGAWQPITVPGFRQMTYGRFRGHTWDPAPIALVTNIRRITLEV